MRARIVSPTPENLAVAAQALSRGEVVGMPTETVYGLAGAALDELALARIFETKERPTFDPLIVHVGFGAKSTYALERMELVDLKELTALARARVDRLMETFWPGPLTLVLPKHKRVPELATSGLPTVALRMPAHRVAQQLLAAAGVPLAAPSANRFGRISPTTAQAVLEELGDRIDWILDGGACEIGVESTVVRVEPSGELTLLRPGGLSRARIEEIAGIVLKLPEPAAIAGASGISGPQSAPGMLESHYAPGKPLHLLPAPIADLDEAAWRRVGELAGSASVGFLLQSGADLEATRRSIAARVGERDVTVTALSRDGDLSEIARGLFAALRSLDASNAQVLFAEPCAVDHGLGHAIADRLRRATAKRG